MSMPPLLGLFLSTGNLVADAYLAAMAIESGCEWVSTDGDPERRRSSASEAMNPNAGQPPD